MAAGGSQGGVRTPVVFFPHRIVHAVSAHCG